MLNLQENLDIMDKIWWISRQIQKVCKRIQWKLRTVKISRIKLYWHLLAVVNSEMNGVNLRIDCILWYQVAAASLVTAWAQTWNLALLFYLVSQNSWKPANIFKERQDRLPSPKNLWLLHYHDHPVVRVRNGEDSWVSAGFSNLRIVFSQLLYFLEFVILSMKGKILEK